MSNRVIVIGSFIAVLLIFTECSAPVIRTSGVWPKEKANEWYNQKGWQRGYNNIPPTAINTIEVWQAESFDAATIDKEPGWAGDH